MNNKILNIEKNISELYNELKQLQEKIFYQQFEENEYEFKHGTPNLRLLEEGHQLRFFHDDIVRSLHNYILCYLDMIGLHKYLDIFIKEFGESPDTEAAYHGIAFEPNYGEMYNEYLHKLLSFLRPFNFFNYELDTKRVGIKYLETILKNTATILHKMGLNPSSEAQVYNQVKIIIESIFPTSKQAGSNFLKTAKEFIPDILIPEIGAVIEYKYAKDETKLKTTIEQIAADAKVYTGDKDYNVFYAVFYVTNDFWGESKFREVWDENKFPKNWQAFYIIGTT